MKAFLTCLTWASVIVAGASAILWFISASKWMNEYADDQKETRSDRMIFTRNGRKIDLVGTTANQSRWSAYAAIATGIVVLLQAIAAGIGPPA
ncbi:hypothetical protein RX330_20400 [Bradyrhizobium sp. NDS-1]|uniref:hypothetical protein n=1 Tax=Bradyrhizobium sp. NDS-1 TaxID=3080014 RepID=UPI00293E0AAB|nr:hypothetical protein [Bradyrhizobium sp. NDS-1]WOH70661.1 hypothetical protein RX330_20400 [Bradyrhizobium sp. NDS-1]